MTRTTKEQLTMVSVVAASRLPARAFGKATKESHSSFQAVSNSSTGNILTGYRGPTNASSDMAVRRHSVTPSYSGIVCAADRRGHFTIARPTPNQQVAGAHRVQPSQGQVGRGGALGGLGR